MQRFVIVVKDSSTVPTKTDPNLLILKFIRQHISDLLNMKVRFKFMRFTDHTLTSDAKAALKMKRVTNFPSMITPKGKVYWGVQQIRGYLETGIRNYRETNMHSRDIRRDNGGFSDCPELSRFWMDAIEINNKEQIDDEKREPDFGRVMNMQRQTKNNDKDPYDFDTKMQMAKARRNQQQQSQQGPSRQGMQNRPPRPGMPQMRHQIANAQINDQDIQLANKLGINMDTPAGRAAGSGLAEPEDNLDIPDVDPATLRSLQADNIGDDPEDHRDAEMMRNKWMGSYDE